MTLPRLRPDIDELPSYKAGQRPVPREDLVSYKISSNENPFPPLPSVLAAIALAAQDIHRYPDPFSTQLIAAIAERFDVPTECISLGTGSVAVCGHIIAAAAGPGDEVVYAWRSFEAYPIWTQIAGATSVQVPLLADERHDLEGMLAAITERTRVVFVCNPNNPTGQVVTEAELVDFLDRVPAGVLVVLDEAYREFMAGADVPDGVEIFRRYPNVVVLRTFSKAYGLAALRVGFAIAHERIAEALRKTATPFGVSTIAEAAAIASLEAEDELLERVRSLVDGARAGLVRAARAGVAGPSDRGQLRVAAARRPNGRVRGRLRGGRHHRPSVRRRGSAHHDRRVRGERPRHRGGWTLRPRPS